MYSKCAINVENTEPLPTHSGELPEHKIHRLRAGSWDRAGLGACDVEEMSAEIWSRIYSSPLPRGGARGTCAVRELPRRYLKSDEMGLVIQLYI